MRAGGAGHAALLLLCRHMATKILIAATGIFLIALIIYAQHGGDSAQYSPPQTQPATGQYAGGEGLDDYLYMISTAGDQSSAIDAYVRGYAVDPHEPRLHAEFMRKMVSLGSPETVEQQAEALISQGVDDGVAYAVQAFSLGRRGRTAEALEMISRAVMLEPENIFVQRLAGELLAWHDFYAERIVLPEYRRTDLQNARRRMDRYWAFYRSYWSATAALQARETPGAPPVGRRRGTTPIVQRYYGYPGRSYYYFEYAHDPLLPLTPTWPPVTYLGPQPYQDRIQWAGDGPFDRSPLGSDDQRRGGY